MYSISFSNIYIAFPLEDSITDNSYTTYCYPIINEGLCDILMWYQIYFYFQIQPLYLTCNPWYITMVANEGKEGEGKTYPRVLCKKDISYDKNAHIYNQQWGARPMWYFNVIQICFNILDPSIFSSCNPWYITMVANEETEWEGQDTSQNSLQIEISYYKKLPFLRQYWGDMWHFYFNVIWDLSLVFFLTIHPLSP